MSELARAGCVLLMLRLVSLILPSALQSIQRCQVCAKLRLTVKVRWPISRPIIARSIDSDTHTFLPWRLLSIELVTVWRGFDSLRGFGGQGSAIDDGNTYFSIFQRAYVMVRCPSIIPSVCFMAADSCFLDL